MKKGIILILFSVLLAIPAIGQEKLVKSVERSINRNKVDFNEARKLIQPALENSQTKDDPHAWYVAGLIEEKAVEKGYLAMQLGKEVDEDQFYTNLYHMIKYYTKVSQLDSSGKFNKKIESPLGTYYQLIINGGAKFLDDKKFKEANEYFQTYLDVKKMPIFHNSKVAEMDSLTMQIGFFNAYAASQIENNTENAIKAFESIKNIPYRQNDVYQLLSLQYYNAKDMDNYLRTLSDGAKLFPEESFFLNNLIDSYIKSNELDKAIDYLDQALVEQPNKPSLYYVYGILYENGYQDINKAIEKFEKSISLDPNYAQGYFSLGRCYFNEGHTIINNADMTDTNKYDKDVAKADELFKKALPNFKKAVELSPDNREYLSALSNCYYVLQMEEERAKVEEIINSL